jgi:filamentous hemagglutinin family protein
MVMKQADRADRARADMVVLRGCNRHALLATTALQAVAAVAVFALVQPATAQLSPNARPAGGQVVAGQASIAATASQTTVTQSSQNAAVNWQSYNVGSAHTVRYVDPSAKSITLNRVTGPNPSEIAGRIVSNGTVIIVNQAGLVFDGSAQINTAGLVVSAAGISNSNLMAGKLVFDQAANPGAKIENRGTITIKEAGLAALVAPQVVNSGVIRAKMGKVILAGAEAETLDLYGDGMLSINVTKQVATAPDGTKALITNTGVIAADGGTVVLTAQAVDGVVSTLVDAGGRISAATAGGRTGRVVVSGVGGDVVVAGTLAADGHASGTSGGSVVVNTTGTVAVASTARISASGPAGGGTIAIGTTLKRAAGGPSVTGQKTAAAVTIAAGATIAANATAKGNGGRVTVLSTNHTTMAGTITAKGGAAGGDGGFVEVSGGLLALTGLVDASAPLGNIGTLLLDPFNLWISDVQPASATYAIVPGDLPNVNAGSAQNAGSFSWVSPGTLEAQHADISLATTNNLAVSSSFGAANTLDLGTHTLTLTADNNLTIDRGFTITAGGYSLTATGGAITLGGTSGFDAGLITAPQIAGLGATTLLGPIGTPATFVAGGAIALSDAVLGATAAPFGRLDLTAGSGVAQAVGGIINAGTLLSSGGVTGTVALAGTANAIGTVGAFAVTSGDFNLFDNGNTGTLTIAGPVSATDVLIDNVTGANVGGTIAIPGQLSATGSLTFAAGSGGIWDDTTGAITAGSLLGSSAGRVDLWDVNHAIGTLGASAAQPFDAAGSLFRLADNISLVVKGLTAASASVAVPAAALTITGPIVASGDVSLQSTANLLVQNTVATSGNMSVAAFNGGTVTLGGGAANAGTLSVTAGNTLAINTDTLVLGAAGGALIAGTGVVEIAPVTATNALSYGGSGSGSGTLGVPAGLTISAGTLRLGEAAGYTTAASIDIASPLSRGTGTLDLETTGAITQTGAISARLLTGHAGAAIALNAANHFGTLSALSAGATLSLTNASDLVVVNTVSAGAGVTLSLGASNLTLGDGASLPGTLAAGTGGIGIAANNVSLAQAGDAIIASGQTVSINAGGTISEGGLGTIAADTLTGSAGTSADFSGSNTIATLGAFTAPGGLTLTDAENLSVAGPVTANSGTVAINDGTFALTLPGTISAHAATLAAGSIGIGGLLSVSGTASLAAANGITETGSIAAATLTGGAGTTADFFGSNTIATLGAFTAPGGLTLTDGENLSVAGPVTANTGTIAIDDGTFALTLPGTISALAATLAADSIGIGGLLSVSGTASLASTGGITETGSIAATTLTGSAGTSADFSGSNSIGTLAGFTAPDGLTLTDSENLSVAGSVAANSGTVTINDGSFALTLPGSISALAATLAAGSIGIGGLLSVTGTASLVSAGSITETGTIAAATLTGSAGTTADFSGSNTIATLGRFTAPDGLTLTDSENLSVAGSVAANGGTVAINDGTFALTLPGTISAHAATLAAGSIGIGGLLSLSGTASLASTGGITETGSIAAATLAGSAGTSADFSGSNTIATLGSFTAPDGLTLTDAGDLSIAGLVAANAGTIAINDGTFALTLPGTISALAATLAAGSISEGGRGSVAAGTLSLTASGGSVDLSAGANALGTLDGSGSTGFAFTGLGALNIGTVTAGTTASVAAPTLTVAGVLSAPHATLTATSGTLGLSGTVYATSASVLSGNAGISGASGTILGAGTLTAASANGPVDLSNAANVISTVSGSAMGDFSLNDSTSLTVASVAAGSGNVKLTALALTLGGDVTAGSQTVTLISAGTIAQSGGIITAGTLTGSSAGGATLGDLNHIGSLAGFANTGTGGLSLTDANPSGLVVTAGVDAGSGDLSLTTAGGLTLGANLTAGTPGGTQTATLISAGTIYQSGGIITAGTLTGSSAGGATLNDANRIGTLAAFANAGAAGFGLTNGGSLTVAGPVDAGTGNLSLTTTSGGLALGGNLTAGTQTVTLISAGTIGQSAGIITARTLTGSSAGGATLNDANRIGTLAAFANSGAGGFGLTNAGSLTVAGTVDAGSGNLSLTTTSGGLGLAANLTAGLSSGTQTVTLISAGTIAQSAGIITAGTLTGSSTGGAALSEANQIGSLAAFANTAGGAFDFTDSVALTVGSVSSPGQVYLADSAGGGITIAATGSVGAGGASLVSFQTDALTILAGGTVTGGTFEIAPYTSGAVLSIGPGDAVSGLSGIGASNLRIGAVTHPGGATVNTAGSIAVGDSIGSGTVNIELDSTGGITEAFGGTITAAILTGTAGGAIALTNANTIAALGSIATSGAFSLDDAGATGEFSITAPLHASSVTIANAGTMLIAGSVDPTSITLSVGTGGITLASDGVLDATPSGTLDLSTLGGGITENGGTIIAGTLISSGSVVGTVALASNNNTIATLGVFPVSGGDLTLKDSRSLSVTGSVAANSITLNAAGIVLTASEILNAPAGKVDIASSAGVTQATGGVINAATLLSSGGVSGGSANFAGLNNDIGTLGSFAVASGGDFNLTNSGSVLLTLNDAVTADNVTITAGTLDALVSAHVVARTGGATLVATTGTLSQLGTVNAPGDLPGNVLLLADVADLHQAGTIDASAVIETATLGNLDHTGTSIARAGGGTFTAGGAVTQTGGSISGIGGSISVTAGSSIQQNSGTIETSGLAATAIVLTANGAGANGITQGALAVIHASDTLGTVSLSSRGTVALSGAITAADTLAGTVSVTAATGLSSGGAVTAGYDAVLTAGSGLTNTGTVSATGPQGSASLIATTSSLLQSGLVQATGAAGTVTETALAGDLTHSGTTSAGSGGAALTATQGLFTQSNGLITAADGTVAITGGTSVLQSGGTVQTTGSSPSAIVQTANGTGANGITQAAGGIIHASDTAGSVSLSSQGTIALSGAIAATGGAVDVTAASGLNTSGSVTAGNDAVLTAGSDLTNTGSVSVTGAQGSATLTATTGVLTQSGLVQATGAAGTVVETALAGGFTHSGTTSAGSGGAALTATQGLFTQSTGLITASNGTVAITAGTSVLQSGGAVQTTGASASAVVLTANGTGANGITQTAGATIHASDTSGSVSLSSGGTIALGGSTTASDTQSGTVSAAAGSSIQSTGSITAGALAALAAQTNMLDSGTISVTNGVATLRAQTGALTQTGVITAHSGGTLTAQSSLNNSGQIAVSNGPAVLHTPGSITQSGVVSGETGSATAGGSLSQTGRITATAGDATLLAGGALYDSGLVAAVSGNVALSGGSGVSVAGGGVVQAGQTASLASASGSISQGGTVAAANVNATAATGLTQTGTMAATAGNATLSTTNGSILLSSASSTSGNYIYVTDTGGPITALGRVAVLPSALPAGHALSAAQLAALATDPAITFTVISNELLTADLSGKIGTIGGGGYPEIKVTLLNGGTALFNVNAPNAKLDLIAVTGAAAGTIDVADLLVQYTRPGTQSEVNLTGSVAGKSGSYAASASFIEPARQNNYLLNGCPIESVNCVRITNLTPPVLNPIRDIQPGQADWPTDTDTVLPDVAERDY